MASREKLRNLHTEIPDAFYRKVKMMCAMRGMTLKRYTAEALERQVARDEQNASEGV